MKDSFEILYLDLKKAKEICPWSREFKLQDTFNELRGEIDEAEQALKNNDDENLKEELGDVLWDALHLIIAAEKEKGFDIKEILDNIIKKHRRRKPYVFGDMKINTKEEAINVWEEIKKKERNGEI